MFKKVWEFVSLKVLTGHRSQITALIALGLNALNKMGWTHFDPAQIETINQFLIMLFGYFFAEKLSKPQA